MSFYLMKEADIPIAENTVTDQAQETLHWLPLDQLQKINLVPAFLKMKLLEPITGMEHIITRE